MQPKTLLSITAVIALIYAIGFLVAPEALADVYGIDTTSATILAIRFFGTSVLGLGLVAWYLRNMADTGILRGVLTGLAISFAVGVGVSAWGTMSGIMNTVGWSATAIYVLLLIGCFLAFPG